jgi:predicted RNA-binding protein with PIN domain
VGWIVDGMNVIGSRPNGWWRDRPAARRRLVAELAAFAGQHGPVTVVFDGHPQPDEIDAGERAGLTVLFAPGGPNAADHVIADLARSSGPSATVVTSDAALAADVRAAGAPVVGVSALRRQLP